MDYAYDNTLTSDGRSRSRLTIAAAYLNVATRAGLTIDELLKCTLGPMNEARARAYAVMMNLAFALEMALKAKIPDEILKTIDPKKRHDLLLLFSKLPKIVQQQAKMTVKNILVIDDQDFDDYLEVCHNGFINWRYFFEPDKAGKEYNYLIIVSFLYALVYYFISGELDIDSILEPSAFKRQCYVGQWGFLKTRYELSKELRQAEKAALNNGNGIISESNEKWLQSLRNRIEKNELALKNIEKEYLEKNGEDFLSSAYIILSPPV